MQVLLLTHHAEELTEAIDSRGNSLTAPEAGARVVSLIVTELAVIGFPNGRATLLEIAPGVSVAQVIEATEAPLDQADRVPEMEL